MSPALAPTVTGRAGRTRHHPRRPSLRAQLTTLYAGLVLAVVVPMLLFAGFLFGRDRIRLRAGDTAPPPETTPQQIDAALTIIAITVVVLTVLIAWWLAGRFLRPLRAMTVTAQEISATNLNRRLGLRGPDDELTRLGRTLDDLFERLDSSFAAQRHFVANASHELRTPLAGQRAVLQVALADPGASEASLRAACEEALDLGERQQRLIDALLTLAEGQKGLEHREVVDLTDVTKGVMLSRRAEATRRTITVEASLAPAPISGDPDLITSMIGNLVDNALHHNVPGGHVTIAIELTNGRARLSVGNTGPAIRSQDLRRLFQPFQRLGTQRTHTVDGHGLGLAIVQAVAEAHGAQLTAHPRPGGGLDVTILFD
ncbi:two-component sensor histidine kinase [Sphaerisporangium krabiense]|uniref:histidine kinase n=1 Tax=Sphaerisporangium krabiense TaxID=763782 RepID=A0A7W8ZBQ1_9ACTN|nr:HAMP domain-containing sensor histidine kinase [Sphaerisporangium krabiense]MBB5630971.1 signal transduction histidine kinase [Sphaerisporangium krabiense]GII65853.1 two-component sensor histidine kinase [Sphaerisporangium krabiense]